MSAAAIIELVEQLDHDRRVGWARVAELENIIDGLMTLLGDALEIVIPRGDGKPPALYADWQDRIANIVDRALSLNPDDRPRWPQRTTTTP